MSSKVSIKRKTRSKILIGLTVILIVLLIYNITTLIDQVTRYKKYDYVNNQSSMENALRDEDYPRLLEMVAENIAGDKETVTDTSEYVALANYYQYVMYYKMYVDVDDEAAAQMKAIADTYRNQLKSDRFLKEADKIDQRG